MKGPAGAPRGFVLTELLVAGLITSVLMLGLVQLAAAGSRSLRLIESLSESQQGGRFAIGQLRESVMSAGFHPAPWNDAAGESGVSEDSVDGGDNGSDVLTVRQLSDRNCYGNPNPVPGDDGGAAFFSRVSTFERTASANLAHTCYYGPEGGTLVRQINREGLVRRVDSFQVLYAEDLDGDLRADRRVRAGHWADVRNVLGVDVALLLATPEPVGDGQASAVMMLDQPVTTKADGRLRRVWMATIPLGSKLR